MANWSTVVWIYFLRTIRLILDIVSDFVFGLIYFSKGTAIEPVRDKILLQSAISLARKIRKQELKSIDIIEAYISRIKDVQPIINAASEFRFEDALEEARKADELIQSGKFTQEELEKQFPYLGVPFTNKESVSVKGMLHTAGLVSSKGNRGSEDADAVALMKKAGGISLATTNVPELCMWWESSNRLYGRSCNPYDTNRIVGGSSGGEGALLAAGGSVIGIGSDIGGSIRMPAFFNGIFGHKTSKGIVSNKGQLPRSEAGFDEFLVTGPMTRYAEDLLPMLKVLAGSNVSKLNLDEKVDIGQLKVYYMEDDGGNPMVTPVTAEMKMAQKKVLKHLQDAFGLKPVNVNVRKMRHSLKIWGGSMAAVPSPSFASYMMEKKGEADARVELFKLIFGCSKFTMPCISYALYELFAADRKPESIKKVTSIAEALRTEFAEMLGDDGIFLYPPHPEPAIYHNQTFFKAFNCSYTTMFNILGLPVTQCPVGLSSNGLPLGVQVVSGLHKDHITIAVAMEIEKAFGGWKNPNDK